LPSDVLLLVFPILGLIAGGLLGAQRRGMGRGLGLALALGLSGAMGWGLVKATRRD
jgi:thiol:disulfide interchange protein